jgi:membrane fusion protein (multidrug efflux system)
MRATFDNPDNVLLHGEFVNVKLYSNNTVKVPVVPQVAIQENQAGKYVYKVDENNIANLVYIKTGIQKGENWVVTEGLKVGDKVVVDGLQKVMPGAPITEITEEDKAQMTSTEKKEKKSKKGHK